MQKYQKLHPLSECLNPDESSSWAYTPLAKEYYNPLLHPTCHNFREASKLILQNSFSSQDLCNGLILEVGSGKSLAAEIMSEMGRPLHQLTLSDASSDMLLHSEQWQAGGAQLMIAEAEQLPVAAETFTLIVASLGDPYNTLSGWQEFYRVLRPGGTILFTTPADEWASLFRDKEDKRDSDFAQFTLQNGCEIRVPSWIYSKNEQTAMIEQAGLSVKSVVSVGLSQLDSSHISPKLLFEELVNSGIVSGYSVFKPPVSCQS
jgi:SAM-dependent methyltransferase